MSQRVLRVGMTATKRVQITQDAVTKFGDLVGDYNPIHSDLKAAKAAGFPNTICYGALTGSLFSGLMATELPGPNTVHLSQTLSHQAPVFVGEEIKLEVELTGFRRDKGLMRFRTTITKKNKDSGEELCAYGESVGINKFVIFEGDTPEWQKDGSAAEWRK
ncbi:3-hydroxyacyl-ACP dehydratase [Angomonas deanei]|uniref:N-terminal half of MaoC dehydratase/MaoC like domain containing protein, putative n=1 Tax=Angomonas deanei TaxID=59799 RepID=A0A7G2CSW4_9TRYP|nr:3-hydroxyacyl-ACP dehydratase [Angomonas deanei]CAD2222121.1 N-terminal half of MaoC dehydratase/MaoC like domain containing protein, putative [Angomonas deanei]|eukprot:EPY41571.1 3-hydroxyacyl-ACP dehydratase [Angomonas deanei]